VREIGYVSGGLKLKAWFWAPTTKGGHPAVLFLHGGFDFSDDDWAMAKPFRDAGYATMVPRLRGENGLPGAFSYFYSEVDDVLAARNTLARLPGVDPKRIFLAGHSVGGTLTMLSAMAARGFRAAASFSGSPDQILFLRGRKYPFDGQRPEEFQMRSPISFAASFKCPARLFFGSQEPFFRLSTEKTAQIAASHGLDVKAIQAPGDHFSAVPAEIPLAITFFRQFR